MVKFLKATGFVLLIACTAIMVLAISPKGTVSDEQLAEYARLSTPEVTTVHQVKQPVYGAVSVNPAYEQELIQHQKNVQHEIDKYYSSLPKDAGSGKDPVPDIYAPGKVIQHTIDMYYSSLPPNAGSGKDPVPDILTGEQLMQRAIDEYYAKH